jgi:23S rRNA (guanosine2251-2'-O)-methyltransferase
MSDIATDTIEGRNPVLEALKAGRPINRVLISRTAQRHSSVAGIVNLARTKGIPVEFVDEQVIRTKSVTPAHQGIIADTASKDYVTLEDLVEKSQTMNEPALYCVLDGVEDPQNLGAMLRTADATGFHGIIIRSRRAVGLTQIVAKVSAGAIEYIPVARVSNIAQALETLKKAGVWVVGIDMSAKQDYTKVDYKGHIAIVVGGEGKGVSDLVMKRCDILARIPMKGKIASLNASVAAAVVMYEAFRQRNKF